VPAVSTSQTARSVLVTASIVAVIYVMWLLRDVVLLALLAVFVAAALSAPVAFVQKLTHAPRALSILIVYLLMFALIAVLGLIIAPPLVEQVITFARHVPSYVHQVQDNATLAKWDKEYGLLNKLEGQAGKLPSLLSGAANDLETVTVGVFERIAKLIAILAVAFLLLLDAPRLFGLFYGRLAPQRREVAQRLAMQSSRAIGGYVAGAFAVAGLAGFVSFLVMELLGIPFAIPLAVQMAFFALIPLVGSAIGAAVIAIVAALEGPGTALAFLAFFVVYQQIETHVLGPFVYKRTVQMRPVLVILVVFAGATLLGILGALLAIPAAATIQIAIQEWWRVKHPLPEAADAGDAADATDATDGQAVALAAGAEPGPA
jgi:predicted PurR-regulated permease PerM